MMDRVRSYSKTSVHRSKKDSERLRPSKVDKTQIATTVSSKLGESPF